MPKSFLNNKQKNRIYELYTEDGFSQKKIAELYNVSQGTISLILKDKRHEVEITNLKMQQTAAMAMGVKSAIQEKGLPNNSDNYLKG